MIPLRKRRGTIARADLNLNLIVRDIKPCLSPTQTLPDHHSKRVNIPLLVFLSWWRKVSSRDSRENFRGCISW